MESDILFFSGHGNSSLMYFYDVNKTNDYEFYIKTGTNNSNSVGISSYNMKNVKLVVYAGCKTAEGTTNITKTTQTNGAKATLGWKVSIGANSHTQWLKRFWSKIPSSFQMSQALSYADSFTYADSGVKNHQSYGNWNTGFSLLKNNETTNIGILENKIDERNNIVNIYADSEEKIIKSVSQYISDNLNNKFSMKDYEIEKTIVDDKIIYDFKLLLNNEIKTSLGYTIFVYNNVITNIFDNVNYNLELQRTLNKIQISKQCNCNEKQALNDANSRIDYTKWNVIEQKSFKYYDDIDNKIYNVVETELINKEDGTYYIDTYRIEI